MIQRQLSIVALFAAATFCGLGLTALTRADPQTLAATSGAGFALDDLVTDKVETVLRTDIGLAGSRIRVTGRSGIVTIVGRVPDEHALRRAIELAASVRGVREVRNGLELGPPSEES